MMLPPIKIKKPRYPRHDFPSPVQPSIARDEPEVFVGEIDGKVASMAEERFYKEVRNNPNIQGLEFRYTVGAPLSLGGKEVDFLIPTFGWTYGIEIDSPFTHVNRNKDQLHDAILLEELRKQGFDMYPEIIHINGEEKLYDEVSTKATVRSLLG